jgi:hypothetical protein
LLPLIRGIRADIQSAQPQAVNAPAKHEKIQDLDAACIAWSPTPMALGYLSVWFRRFMPFGSWQCANTV